MWLREPWGVFFMMSLVRQCFAILYPPDVERNGAASVAAVWNSRTQSIPGCPQRRGLRFRAMHFQQTHGWRGFFCD